MAGNEEDVANRKRMEQIIYNNIVAMHSMLPTYLSLGLINANDFHVYLAASHRYLSLVPPPPPQLYYPMPYYVNQGPFGTEQYDQKLNDDLGGTAHVGEFAPFPSPSQNVLREPDPSFIVSSFSETKDGRVDVGILKKPVSPPVINIRQIAPNNSAPKPTHTIDFIMGAECGRNNLGRNPLLFANLVKVENNLESQEPGLFVSTSAPAENRNRQNAHKHRLQAQLLQRGVALARREAPSAASTAVSDDQPLNLSLPKTKKNTGSKTDQTNGPLELTTATTRKRRETARSTGSGGGSGGTGGSSDGWEQIPVARHKKLSPAPYYAVEPSTAAVYNNTPASQWAGCYCGYCKGSLASNDVKIWFQNRRTKWKKKDNISNAVVAEMKQQTKMNHAVATREVILDTKKKYNKILNQKIRGGRPASTATSQRQMVDRRARSHAAAAPAAAPATATVATATVATAGDFETHIAISQITQSLANADLSGGGVSVRSFSPQEGYPQYYNQAPRWEDM